MGFDQVKTAHHFRLTTTGGAIEVVARDPADGALVAQVRSHLRRSPPNSRPDTSASRS
jgi:hypothetical protein